VTVATAIERDVPVYLDQIGKNVAPEVVTIQAQVSGRITAIHVKDGATVKRGDLLFTIDPRPYRAQLESAEANVSRNVAELELARLEFGRVQACCRRTPSRSRTMTRAAARSPFPKPSSGSAGRRSTPRS